MRMKNIEPDTSQLRSKKGRVVLLGYGLDDDAGHLRYTRSGDCELLGGSEETHAAIYAKALKIKNELLKLGYALDNISRDQVDEVRRLVDRISSE